MYTLKNVKIHEDMSDETTCFSASIHCDGRRIGTVSNQGCGGSNEYYFPRHEDRDALDEYAKSQPHEYDFEIMDQCIDALLSTYEERRWLKRRCKKATLFRLKENTDAASWLSLSHTYSEDVKKYLQTKYGDKLDVIANESIVQGGSL